MRAKRGFRGYPIATITFYGPIADIAVLKEHAAKFLIVTDDLIGCSHGEGIDYPEGKSWPLCPYWAGRDRFTREHFP